MLNFIKILFRRKVSIIFYCQSNKTIKGKKLLQKYDKRM